jgi:hypothetical protein
MGGVLIGEGARETSDILSGMKETVCERDVESREAIASCV